MSFHSYKVFIETPYINVTDGGLRQLSSNDGYPPFEAWIELLTYPALPDCLHYINVSVSRLHQLS